MKKEIVDSNIFFNYAVKVLINDCILPTLNLQNLNEPIEFIISIDNILEKANDDAQNDICTEAKYLDGGSIEYWYSDYTILKYNKEYIGKNNRKDFVIGMKKEIINKVDEILEKDERLDDTAALSEDSGWLNNQ